MNMGGSVKVIYYLFRIESGREWSWMLKREEFLNLEILLFRLPQVTQALVLHLPQQ